MESRFAHFVFGRALVVERVERPPAFLAAVECSRCRVALHRCLGSVLTRSDSSVMVHQFLETYDGLLERDEESMRGFLCDFTGLLESARKPEHYLSIKVLPNIIDEGLLTISVRTIIALPKMWSEVLRNEPTQIEFKAHSDSGVVLFHRTADLVCTLFGTLRESFQIKFKACPRSLILILRIIHRAITATYVPFGACERFHDDSLTRLLSSFGKAPSFVPFSPLLEHTKPKG
jgi:hypothetical protein